MKRKILKTVRAKKPVTIRELPVVKRKIQKTVVAENPVKVGKAETVPMEIPATVKVEKSTVTNFSMSLRSRENSK